MLFVRVIVGVMLLGQLVVGLLDLLLSGCRLHVESLVQTGFLLVDVEHDASSAHSSTMSGRIYHYNYL